MGRINHEWDANAREFSATGGAGSSYCHHRVVCLTPPRKAAAVPRAPGQVVPLAVHQLPVGVAQFGDGVTLGNRFAVPSPMGLISIRLLVAKISSALSSSSGPNAVSWTGRGKRFGTRDRGAVMPGSAPWSSDGVNNAPGFHVRTDSPP